MKILIAVPTFENICPDTFKSIYELDPAGHQLVFDFVRGYDCATARNNIVAKAKNEKVDYVLMVDSDLVLPKDALKNLLEDPKDVCLGFCARRTDPSKFNGTTCIYKLGEFSFTQHYTADELKDFRENGEHKVQIHGGGMACALIRVDVFDRIQYPWFDWVNYKTIGQLSEDLYFCVQCKNADIPIHVDTRVGCGHVLRYVQNVM